MKSQLKQDVEDLEKSVEYAVDSFLETNNPSLIADKICHFIIEETARLLDAKAADESHFYFDNAEIYKRLKGGDDSAKARKWMKDHEDNIFKFFSEMSPLNTLLAEKGLSTFYLQRVDSKGGKPTQWRLRTGQAIVPTQSLALEPSDVRYVVTKIHEPAPWAKPFLQVVLSPARLAVTALTLLFLILTPIFMLLGFISFPDKTIGTIVLLLGLFAGHVFYRFNELLNKGVTEYPVFWSKDIFAKNKLFLSTPTEEESRPLGMKAVTIEARCSICGADLMIDKSKEFHGRYVGKCRYAPSEHIFSFDHITKTGKFLR